MHCHIAWHASEGLSLEFVEDQAKIAVDPRNAAIFKQQCAAWDRWVPGEVYPQDDSGI